MLSITPWCVVLLVEQRPRQQRCLVLEAAMAAPLSADVTCAKALPQPLRRMFRHIDQGPSRTTMVALLVGELRSHSTERRDHLRHLWGGAQETSGTCLGFLLDCEEWRNVRLSAAQLLR